MLLGFHMWTLYVILIIYLGFVVVFIGHSVLYDCHSFILILTKFCFVVE